MYKGNFLVVVLLFLASFAAVYGGLPDRNSGVFLNGMYDDSGNYATYDIQHRLSNLDAIIQSKFNLMTLGVTWEDAFQPLFDRINSSAFALIELDWSTANRTISTWKSHPSLLGVVIGDDINTDLKGKCDGAPKFDRQSLLYRHNLVKAICPNCLTYASGLGIDLPSCTNMTEYIGVVDIIGIQSYPIAEWEDEESFLQLNMNNFMAVNRAFASSLWKNTTFLANYQSFHWPNYRWPTAMEARNMIYGSLMSGAKGLLAYTFSTSYNSSLPVNAPLLWKEMIQVRHELETIESYLLADRRTELFHDNHIYATQWEWQSTKMIVILNAGVDSTAVNIPIQSLNGNYRLEKAFSERPATLLLSESRISGDLPGRDVQVYYLFNSMDSVSEETQSSSSFFLHSVHFASTIYILVLLLEIL